MKLFIRRGEKIYGPYPLRQVKELLDQGRLVEKDLASENKQTWEDLKNFLDNKNSQEEESSLPPPESEPNNEVSKKQPSAKENDNDLRFLEWLENNVIERDATYDVVKKFSNKSLDEIIQLANLEDSSKEELNSWKTFYESITQWVEVSFEFQDLVRIADSFDDWSKGELFFDSSKLVRVGINNEMDETEITYWGIRNSNHLKLKLKEFVDIWNHGYVTEAEAFMLIPNEFGGEREDYVEFKIPIEEQKKPADEEKEKKSTQFDNDSKYSPFRPKEITETFGFKPEDAIPTPNIQATELAYLPLLATPDKARVKWERIGSMHFDFGIVDEFKIFDQKGRFIYSIFVNPYGSELSQRAPQGLIVFRPMKDIHEKMMKDNPDLKRQLDSVFQQALSGSHRTNDKMTKDEWISGIGCLAFLIIGGYFLVKWILENYNF
jgi:hypothetical protein